MGLKGYRLWLWVNLIQRAEPHLAPRATHEPHPHAHGDSAEQQGLTIVHFIACLEAQLRY
jgi:hypothetical protein